MRNFVSLKDLSRKELIRLVELSFRIKKKPSLYRDALRGKDVGLLFQKPSLRTKTSFYVGAMQMGARVVYYSPEEVKLGQREKVSDAARTLAGYLNGIVLRTFSHSVIEEFAKVRTLAVINALSDLLHPSQVLGDLLTLYELKKDVKKIKFVYIGDGNNVCHSLIYAFSILGGNIFIATPKGYTPDRKVLQEATQIAKKSNAKITMLSDPKRAALLADVLYTDVWASMGKEKEMTERKKVFKRFRIDDKILKMAKKSCIVMHCLPAHRGEEITDSVIDGKNSVVFKQAQNRLYSAKAILLYTLRGKVVL